MKKKSLLSLLFLLMFFGIAKAETIQVGSGTASGPGMPIYSNWKYGLTQQIYTSEEIGKTGTITSIAFKAVQDMGQAQIFDIYLVKTNKSTFDDAQDYISASESDKVFSGTVTFAVGDWTTLTLDKPFDYDGSANLCLIVNSKTGPYPDSSAKSWLVYSSTNQSIWRLNDGYGPYDPASPKSVASGPSPKFVNYKSQLQLTFAESSGTPIHSVNVNGYESPVAGENATDHLNITLPSDANYNFATTPYWYNDDANKSFTGTFVAGTHYSLGMTLRANDGYYFADDCTFYLNGSTELVDNTYTAVNSEDNSMAYFWSVSVAATEGGGSSAEVIDFETGDFSQFSFQNDSEYPWIVTSSDAASGTYCMKSGNVGVDSSSSIISTTYTFEEDGYISFDAKCMGEGANTAWDKCIFYIDGEAQFTYGAYKTDSWETYYFLVTAGTHTFKWEYTKDSSVNPDGDAFFVDNIQFGLGEPCVALSELAYKLTESSATLTWKGFSEYFSLRYRKDGGDWQYVNALTEKSYTLTDLASGIYDVEVQASCNTSTCSATFEIAGALSTAEWYAYAAYSMDGADWQNKFVNFSMQDVSTVQAVSPVLPENWAVAFADGYVWFITKDYGDLCRAPLYTETNSLGDYEVVVSGFETEGVAKEMAYNVADGKMYYLIDYNSGTKLKSFSPNDLSNVGGLTFDLVIQAFAINKNGEAYGIEYKTGKLYRINLEDCSTTLVGETGLSVSYVQSMAFDMETDELFWAQISGVSDVGIYKVNTATAVATYIGKTGTNGAELTGLFMLPSNAAKTAYIDFETGDFSQFTFENGSEYPWIVTSSDAADGTYCMMSGNAGVASSRSAIIATYTFDEDGYISFDAKCMGEGVNTVWDPCVFSIDNNDQFVYGARGDTWYAHVYPVAAGTHTFKWEYWKDNSQDPLGDAFFVDNIRFLQGNSALDVIATDISSVKSDEDEEIIYNLAGQRLAKKQKGVNIVNGRKILVK